MLDGIIISDLEDIFKVNRTTILTSWVALGLKLSFKKVSESNIFSYITIADLYEFLENNQDIWDARLVERNLFGIEPEWLKKKRAEDWYNRRESHYGIKNLTRQQLIKEDKYYLSEENEGYQKKKK